MLAPRRSPLQTIFPIASLFLSMCFPAFAQTAGGQGSKPEAPSSTIVSNQALGDDAPQAILTQTHGAWRTSELLGATVHNEKGNTLGTVDDLLLAGDGRIKSAIISVSGFLALGNKLVQVPFTRMKIVPSQVNPASQGAPTTGATQSQGMAPQPTTEKQNNDFGLILPGATRASLNSEPEFHFN